MAEQIDLKRLIGEVFASDLFDEAFYAHASGCTGARASLAEHYVREGERRGFAPSQGFDPVFYSAANPDLSGTTCLLEHYIAHGRDEGRYALRPVLKMDGIRLRESSLYDESAFAVFLSSCPIGDASDAEAYLLQSHKNRPIAASFDAAFYRAKFADAHSCRRPAVMHYLEVGRSEARVTTPGELERRRRLFAPHFDRSHYLAQFRVDDRPTDPLEHYILHGERLGYEPAPDFSPDYYLRKHPDVGFSACSPYEHFLGCGSPQGLLGRPGALRQCRLGGTTYDPAKPSLALVQSPRADLFPLGCLLARELSTKYNVICINPPKEQRQDELIAACCMLLDVPFDEADAEYALRELATALGARAVVLNSGELWPFALGALYAELPSVALVHEFPQYAQPPGRIVTTVEFASLTVVPCGAVETSTRREVAKQRGNRAPHLTVMPQPLVNEWLPDPRESTPSAGDLEELFRLDASDRPKIVLASGVADMRNGLDLFVRAAAEARRLTSDDVRFVWVGTQYRPKTDITYCFWVAELTAKLGVEKSFHFISKREHFPRLLSAADLFVQTARLEAYPRAALDALVAGRTVIAFEGTSCLDDVAALHPGSIRFVPYGDVAETAREIVTALGTQAPRPEAILPALRDEHDAGRYVERLQGEILRASAGHRAVMGYANRLMNAGRFDAAFHDGALLGSLPRARHRAALTFAARATKGLAAFNPRPGCEAGAALAQPEGLNQLPSTHRCLDLDALPPPTRSAGARIALHLHLHYPDLAAEFRDRLNALGARIDLFISVNSPGAAVSVQREFLSYDFGSVRIAEVPNQGRDIAPLLSDFSSPLRDGGYELIGHLHGKRSVTAPADLGNRWRLFLQEVLLGDAISFMKLVSLFERENSLGLVFAEDRYSVGWNGNRAFAERLAAELSPCSKLPAFPTFPKGTMFWCRPAALAPLWQRGFLSADFPPEPLPDDGSILHAIERMLPAITESVGLSWCTLYRRSAWW